MHTELYFMINRDYMCKVLPGDDFSTGVRFSAEGVKPAGYSRCLIVLLFAQKFSEGVQQQYAT